MVMGGEEQALAATEEACRVYVGNLLPKAKERHLTSKFARFGTIHSVWIARRPPGFAFVRFAAPDAAQRAVKACREEGAMEILGKAVRVQMAGDKDRKAETKSGSKVEEWQVDSLRSRRRSRSPGHRGRAEDSRYRRGRSRSSERDGRERHCRRSRSRSRGSSRRDRHKDRSRSRSVQRAKSMCRSRSRRRDASRSSSRSRNHEGARRRRGGRRDYRSSSRGS